VDVGGELGVNGVGTPRPEAKHLALPSGAIDAAFELDGIVDADVAAAEVLGASGAFGKEDARIARALGGATLEDIDDAPAEDGRAVEMSVRGRGVVGCVGCVGAWCVDEIADEIPHEAVGAVHGGEGLDGAADVGAPGAGRRGDGARDELGGAPEIGVEEIDLVAADFLDARAADGGLAGGEDADARAGGDVDGAGGDATVDDAGDAGAGEQCAKIFVHALALFERAGEDADLHGGLEEEVEERGDRAEECLAAAAAGPDDAVGGARGGRGEGRESPLAGAAAVIFALEVGVDEVFERSAVAVNDGAFGDGEAEVAEEPFVEFVGRLRAVVAGGEGGVGVEDGDGGVGLVGSLRHLDSL